MRMFPAISFLAISLLVVNEAQAQSTRIRMGGLFSGVRVRAGYGANVNASPCGVNVGWGGCGGGFCNIGYGGYGCGTKSCGTSCGPVCGPVCAPTCGSSCNPCGTNTVVSTSVPCGANQPTIFVGNGQPPVQQQMIMPQGIMPQQQLGIPAAVYYQPYRTFAY